MALYTLREGGAVTVADSKRDRDPVRFESGEPVRCVVHIGSLGDGGIVCSAVGPEGLVTLYEIGTDDIARPLSRDDFMARSARGVAWM